MNEDSKRYGRHIQ